MSQRHSQIIEFADSVSDLSRHFALWSYLVVQKPISDIVEYLTTITISLPQHPSRTFSRFFSSSINCSTTEATPYQFEGC